MKRKIVVRFARVEKELRSAISRAVLMSNSSRT
jgi:hypothetical protein